MTRRLADWVRRPAIYSFKWGNLTWGDLLLIAVLLAGLALLVIIALTDGWRAP